MVERGHHRRVLCRRQGGQGLHQPEPRELPGLRLEFRRTLHADSLSRQRVTQRQGAFQGTKPSDAFFVRCDSTTTTQDDINRGVVNILVGFAPLKPAEFVIIRIQQLAGQTAA